MAALSAAALARAEAMINAIPDAGVTNGQYVFNTAMPASSHVRDRARWVLREATNAGDPAENASLVDHICWMSRVDVDTAARTAVPAGEKLAIRWAVLLALGRSAAWRYLGMQATDLKSAETYLIPRGTAEAVVHNDHDAAVASALDEWAAISPRLTAIIWYNALSFETASHHHLPQVTGRLAKTTITMLGLRGEFETHTAEEAEGLVMHDLGHPVSHDLKATLARNREKAKALTGLGFDNLRKRIPVKASDCALAINYPVLIRKARTYAHTLEDLPNELNAPAQLLQVIEAYNQVLDAAGAQAVTEELRAMSAHLAEPSVYIAGFMLGRERRASDDEDLTLKQASKVNTILGSPAYTREAGEHPGTFNLGCACGWRKPSKAVVGNAHAEIVVRVRYGMSLAVHAREVVLATRNAAPAPPVPAAPGAGRGWFG